MYVTIAGKFSVGILWMLWIYARLRHDHAIDISQKYQAAIISILKIVESSIAQRCYECDWWNRSPNGEKIVHGISWLIVIIDTFFSLYRRKNPTEVDCSCITWWTYIILEVNSVNLFFSVQNSHTCFEISF